MKIKDLALLVDGIVEGDDNIEISSLCGIDKAKAECLTFAIDENKLSLAEISEASCVLTTKTTRKSTKALIRVNNPKLSFLMVYNALNSEVPRDSFIHPTACVSASAKIGKNVWIGSNAYIGENVTIGDTVIIDNNSSVNNNCIIGCHCHLHANVTLYENVEIGNNVILHSGVVLGSDGFGYVKDKGKIYKFPQLGTVKIGDDVEIGANTTIDRGSLGDTVIGSGSKIDNLCQIAHNVKIGKNMLMAGQCGISGSTVIGDNVTMGGQAGIIDNLIIEDNVTIAAKSAVIGNLKKGTVNWGCPARPIAQTKRQMAVLSWLTENFKFFRKLKG